MQIDWLTVAAQIVNFLVLVWLLQRFLYKPITNAMRRREERIEERLEEAKSARREAEERSWNLDEERSKLEARKEEILDQARKEAEELRERLEEEVRQDMEDKRATWHRHLAEERRDIVTRLRRKAGHELLGITRRILSDYADSDLAGRVVENFIERLERLDSETRDRLSEAAKTAEGPALIQTGSAIDTASRRRITRALHDKLSSGIDVEYGEDGDMLLGVRLTIGDQTVEWSVVRYLKRLETELDEQLDAVGHAGQESSGSESSEARGRSSA